MQKMDKHTQKYSWWRTQGVISVTHRQLLNTRGRALKEDVRGWDRGQPSVTRRGSAIANALKTAVRTVRVLMRVGDRIDEVQRSKRHGCQSYGASLRRPGRV